MVGDPANRQATMLAGCGWEEIPHPALHGS